MRDWTRRVILFGLICVIGSLTPVAGGERIVVDERYDCTPTDIGSRVPLWEANEPHKDNRVPVFQADQVNSPDCGASITNDFGAHRDFSAVAGIVVIDIWMKPRQGSDSNNMLLVISEANAYTRIGKNSNNVWSYTDADHRNEITFFGADNRGHRLRIKIDTDAGSFGFDFDVDGDGVFDPNSDIHRSGLRSHAVGEAVVSLSLNSGRGGSGRPSHFDDLRVFEITPTQTVAIDIKPGSDHNPINLKIKGVIPVAILTTDDFDASTVVGSSVKFAGASPAHGDGHLEDVDGDGDSDWIGHFKTQDTTIESADTEATLTGTTTDGIDIEGADPIGADNGNGKGRKKPAGAAPSWGEVKRSAQ